MADQDWTKLLTELQQAKKTEEQILESLTLAITGRLPTETEKKLVANMMAKEKDKTAAWASLATTLAGTNDAKQHAEKLKPAAQRFRILTGEMILNHDDLKILPIPPATKPPEPKK